ncbi:glutamate--cysteine ligase [Pseudomonas guariconensis]|uniref:glutamate--cysteine ligase n=1 Tax=Pseudomonas TaxID=286 RepID=UPI001CE43E45|nr:MULTISPECIES: glutamate--cysteine ligase [Pseudomonas]MCO7639709.1 glutamate--cysteine ligase [Pseudomonas sp. S 311-6]MCO7514405.1 glutamate--cysteine ligase [Pseudomonas putida]MCO7565149.1 glutamate--cysteine ligase [Pseudomonas mosselii]MCO7593491.1 glutamate--cysteine ligase [Pseudomonas guariconensis]MCO7604458.1 glutamate--cysteine ligase [Pseudomonas guariconensis]
MSELLNRRLSLLGANLPLLKQCLHGIERECLRVTDEGRLAQTPHPEALGSALTNEQITTDYSESLLEFITPALADPAQVLENLEEIHRFVYSRLGDEYLWSPSMPCALPAEDDIPIAEYGTSNIGKLKHVYRKGLALRYGRTMQCIAGIHYNFSLPEALWPLLRQAEGSDENDRDFQSAAYIALIRNFRRYSWLLMYLFGASPALDAGFLRGRPHQLEQFDAETLYLPYATSLRMSDLGYQSNAQAGLTPCYNNLASYTDSLRKAVGTPYPPYVAIGTHKDGEWVQLNTNILQIENEYYSNIRPKRVTYTGERPIQALMARGVQYVEVRCLDINPFLPVGIDLSQARFLDAFLLFCALDESPLLDNGECGQCTSNFLTVVKEGRRPGLELRRDGQPISLKDWAGELITRIAPLAELLDRAQGGDGHAKALAAQQAKIDDPALTPSAQVLARMTEREESFVRFALRQSQAHAETFREQPLPAERQQAFDTLARQSLAEQARLEQQEVGDFDLFVGAYQASILAISN